MSTVTKPRYPLPRIAPLPTPANPPTTVAIGTIRDGELVDLSVSDDDDKIDWASIDWTGNVRPVDEATTKAALDSLLAARTEQAAQDGRPRLKRIQGCHVKHLHPDVVEALCCMAAGLSVGKTAKATGLPREDLARMRKWVGQRFDVRIQDLQALPDKSPVAIREYLESRRGGR